MAFQQQFPFGTNSGAAQQQQTRGAFPLLRTVHRHISSPSNSMGAARHGSGARAYGQQSRYVRPNYSPGPYPGRRARSNSRDRARSFNIAREGTTTPRASSRLNEEEQQDQWDSLLSRITALETANRNLAQMVAAMGVEAATKLDGRYVESEAKFKNVETRLLQSNNWHCLQP